MHKEIADQWVAALRSDEYGQTYGYLREEYEPGKFAYCALGVLCDLHRKHTGGKWINVVGEYRYLGRKAELPEAVAAWAGTSINPDAFCRELGGYEPISEINDGGMSFPHLADLIEEQWQTV
jgi:hypothetical protein